MSKAVRVPPLSRKQRIDLDQPYQKTDKPIVPTRAEFPQTRLVSRRKKPTRLMITIWAAYLIAGSIFLLWIVNESRQFLASYQRSPQCSTEVFNASPQNCRMMVKVSIYGKWISNALGGGAKGGGDLDKMNFIVGLPNGDRRTLSVPINNHGTTERGEFNWFYIARFEEMEQGTIAQAEYWEGQVRSITIPLPVLLRNPSTEITQQIFHTVDHPVYSLTENLSKGTPLLGILFIALTLWTAFLLLRN